MRTILIKFVLYLLGYASRDTIRRADQREIDEWLVYSYRHPGFHEFVAQENLNILKTGMNSSQPDDKYKELVGSRVLLKKIASLAKEKYSRYIKEEARKQPMKAENEAKAVERLESRLLS